MISVILYGRNDAHGYNLHRRAALSLNCIAEVLTDPDDEIVFVDYNTPDELPTFIEAIADTLTERCLDLLRVFRVPAALHRERFAALTHLPALEPVARNAGVRRAKPANRWLLSTNTDMILIPRSGPSLSEICADLADGYYGLPRYELPEWLWERMPRTDPRRTLAHVARLGPRLHLDESTLGHRWNRFDAPGDFQLCLREDFVEIDGCDEEMVLGWHVDSNLSRRMLIHRGSIESLEHAVAGYHCNHSRTPTVYHGAFAIANDLPRFFELVTEAELPSQHDSWGLVDDILEEVLVRDRVGSRFADALSSVVPPPNGPKAPSQDVDAIHGLTYDTEHVLPFVADSLAVSPSGIKVGYVGCNSALEDMLELLAAEFQLELICASDVSTVERVADSADLIVVDLGLDTRRAADAGLEPDEIRSPSRFPAQLQSVMDAFERLVDHERGRLESGEHPRRFVLVHSMSKWTDAYVLTHLDCSHTSPHSRVRRATVKPFHLASVEPRPSIERDQQLVLHLNRRVTLVELEDFRAFDAGWENPDEEAIWTRGTRADLAVALGDALSGRTFLAVTFGRVGAYAHESLPVHLMIDGARIATGVFLGGVRPVTWRVELPVLPVAKRAFGITFVFEPPNAWAEDERQLGLHVRSLAIEQGVVRRWVRDDVDRLRTFARRVARRMRSLTPRRRTPTFQKTAPPKP